MRVLEITGLLECCPEWPGTGPAINGQNLLEEIVSRFGDASEPLDTGSFWDSPFQLPELTVLIGAHVLHGSFVFTEGDQGYSEYTDWVLDRMEIGGIDLVKQLESFDGQLVTIRVDDGAPAILPF